MQIQANDVVGLELARNGAIAYARNHGSQCFGLLHEILGADGIVEPFTDSNIGELDAVAAFVFTENS